MYYVKYNIFVLTKCTYGVKFVSWTDFHQWRSNLSTQVPESILARRIRTRWMWVMNGEMGNGIIKIHTCTIFTVYFFFCSNHFFIAFVQKGLKENGKKNRVKYGYWQFDFICINESNLIFANTFIYSYCNFFFLIFLYFIPFIIYYMSFHLYLNGHTIFIPFEFMFCQFLEWLIDFQFSFWIRKFPFLLFFFISFHFLQFPLFSRWLSDCLYLKLFQWVYVKVLAELEILESNAVCYYVWSLILLFHLHLWVYFDLMSILLLVFCFLSSLACESDVWKVIIVSQLCFAY